MWLSAEIEQRSKENEKREEGRGGEGGGRERAGAFSTYQDAVRF